MHNLPQLYFTKRNKETGIVFEDTFSVKNCPNWYRTPFGELNILAKARIDHWNKMISSWEYEIVGWRLE